MLGEASVLGVCRQVTPDQEPGFLISKTTKACSLQGGGRTHGQAAGSEHRCAPGTCLAMANSSWLQRMRFGKEKSKHCLGFSCFLSCKMAHPSISDVFDCMQ